MVMTGNENVAAPGVCPFCSDASAEMNETTGRDFRPVVFYGELGRGYYACPDCGSIILWPTPEVEPNAEFSDEAAAGEIDRSDRARAGYFAKRLDWIEAAASTGRGERGALLELGCSTGELLAIAAGRGWRVCGLELSAPLAERARRRNPGVEIREGDLLADGVMPQGPFEAVIALDVLEHVLDPNAALRRIAAALTPGGVALIQTPNAASLRARLGGGNWNMLIPQYHFHLPSPQGIRAALGRAGLEPIRVSTASGTGEERGARAIVSALKEAALSAFDLGNGLVALARKRA